MHAIPLPARFSRTVGSALLVALCFSAGSALGSPDYPSVVKAEVPMACTPDCTLCHTVTPGLDSTATQPFVYSLAAGGGAIEKNPDRLRSALGYMKTMQTDADGDTFSDINELLGTQVGTTGQLTTNPNVVDTADMPSADICPPEPKYGCGAAHVTPRPHVHAELGLFGLLSAVLGLGLWRRFGSRRQG